MGKKKDKKAKKGKGAEKTAQKTEKKLEKKSKKELAEKGEEDIEAMIAEFQEQDKRRNQTIEEKTGPPSPRCNMSLTAHPDKEELIMFGGEFFNGSKTFMYNEMYFYNIRKNDWLRVSAPNAPPPRCSHQAVSLKQGGGQLWMFGGEFASPTQSQFYHYKDLWVYHLSEKKWEKINAPGGPSSRSGHRMVAFRKLLIVFGGFHDNIRDYKYYNDVHMFNLETYTWVKVVPSGVGPSPRSGCQLAVLPDQAKIIVYGGYSKDRVKRDVDQGTTHSDMFALCVEDKRSEESTPMKWKWQPVKQSGLKPSPRCGFTLATGSANKAYLFGGVFDKEENEEQVDGVFYNELYCLELDKGKWHEVLLRGKKSSGESKKRRRRKDKGAVGDDAGDEGDDETGSEEEGNEFEEEIKKLKLNTDGTEELASQTSEVTTYDDGIFKVTIGPQSQTSNTETGTDVMEMDTELFMPKPRMNTLLTIKHNVLYLYGGIFEIGDKQITMDDLYSLDLNKMDEWNTLITGSFDQQEWQESDSSSEEEMEDEEEEGDDEVNLDLDDAPDIEEEETDSEYFSRTQEYWLEKTTDHLGEAAEEMTASNIKKKARELATMYYETEAVVEAIKTD